MESRICKDEHGYLAEKIFKQELKIANFVLDAYSKRREEKINQGNKY